MSLERTLAAIDKVTCIILSIHSIVIISNVVYISIFFISRFKT